RQIARVMRARFDERLAERTRLAREFHDTLLQTIQGSKMVADDALESSDPDRMRGAMSRLSSWLGQAIDEGRAAIMSLRISSSRGDDLAESLRGATEECLARRSMVVNLSVIGEVLQPHPIVREEIYRIGYEAIRNACQHSNGTRLNVS